MCISNALWTFLVPKVAIISKNSIVFFIAPKFFDIFDDFSKLHHIWHSPVSTLKNHQIRQTFWRKWRKVFQSSLLLLKNDHFWNQKCSQCNAYFFYNAKLKLKKEFQIMFIKIEQVKVIPIWWFKIYTIFAITVSYIIFS